MSALVVRLEDLDLVEALCGACLLADLDQAVVVVAAVGTRLANAEQVEVGAVDDECFHGCFLCGWSIWRGGMKNHHKGACPLCVGFC